MIATCKRPGHHIYTSELSSAGFCIHEYLDAWWKFGLEDSYTQDPDDVEEWFGLVKLKNSGDWYSTEFRSSYYALKNYNLKKTIH